MKMIYGGVPVNSMKLKHYEISTNDCDMVASDLQAGKTAVAKGRKITGTGKSFEFAECGVAVTNMLRFVPSIINVVEIASTEYPIKSLIGFDEIIHIDFASPQTIGTVVIDDVEYPISLSINNNALTFSCEKTVSLQFFYGKDNYI